MSLSAYHFSVDDSFEYIYQLYEMHPLKPSHESGRVCASSGLLQFYDELHRDFNAEVDLYFYLNDDSQDQPRSLRDVAGALECWFDARPWLRLAPHALDKSTPPHAQSVSDARTFYDDTARQLARIAGHDRHSHWVRLHYFSECYELASCLGTWGVEALLTTDKPIASYRLPPSQAESLRQFGVTHFAETQFIRSHVRIENLVDRGLDDESLDKELQQLIGNHSCAVIFTHEYELVRPEVQEMTRRVFCWIKKRRLKPISDPHFRQRLSDMSQQRVPQ